MVSFEMRVGLVCELFANRRCAAVHGRSTVPQLISIAALNSAWSACMCIHAFGCIHNLLKLLALRHPTPRKKPIGIRVQLSPFSNRLSQVCNIMPLPSVGTADLVRCALSTC